MRRLALAVLAILGTTGCEVSSGVVDGVDSTVTVPAVGTCIERPAADVLKRAQDDEPAEFKVRPVVCDERPNLQVTEHRPASAAYNMGNPIMGQAGGPNCDPPADHWAIVAPPGGRQVVICLADQA